LDCSAFGEEEEKKKKTTAAAAAVGAGVFPSPSFLIAIPPMFVLSKLFGGWGPLEIAVPRDSVYSVFIGHIIMQQHQPRSTVATCSGL
jgi:hypothetical protein